jgi:hypothetical protein
MTNSSTSVLVAPLAFLLAFVLIGCSDSAITAPGTQEEGPRATATTQSESCDWNIPPGGECPDPPSDDDDEYDHNIPEDE